MGTHLLQGSQGRLDRWAGLLLVGFVGVQAGYLFIDLVVVPPPAPDAPIGEFRELVIDHGATLRRLLPVPLASFLLLFLPACVGLRRRLGGASARGSASADLVLAAALLLVMSVFVTLMTIAVLGLVPEPELSDSVLRAMVMINVYSSWVAGGFATALFLAAASIAMYRADPAPRLLAHVGIAAAALTLVGQLWLLSGDVGSPFFAVGMLSRAAFLGWVAATGLWLHRYVSLEQTSAPLAAPVR